MTDIEAFIRARLDEIEAVALACKYRRWEFSYGILVGYVGPSEPIPRSIVGPDGKLVAQEPVIGSDWAHLAKPVYLQDPKAASLTHAALHDPDAVLADLASIRLILTMWAGYRDRCANGPGYDTDEYTLSALDDVVAHLAYRWSNHPDFDPSWRVA